MPRTFRVLVSMWWIFVMPPLVIAVLIEASPHATPRTPDASDVPLFEQATPLSNSPDHGCGLPESSVMIQPCTWAGAMVRQPLKPTSTTMAATMATRRVMLDLLFGTLWNGGS